MNERTLGRGAGVSNLLFGVYTIFVALLGLALAYRGGALVTAGGSPYYAMMGTTLLLSAILIGLKQSLGIYLYGTASLATYAWAIWESGYDGWAFIPRLAWLAVLSVLFLAFWPLVRRDFANARRSHYFAIMGLLPILMGGTRSLSATNKQISLCYASQATAFLSCDFRSVRGTTRQETQTSKEHSHDSPQNYPGWCAVIHSRRMQLHRQQYQHVNR